jgi:hypothetical protein
MARITWDDNIKKFFTQGDVGCMGARGLNLDDYEDVKNNKDEILDRVSDGSMPEGGPPWSQEKVKAFSDWMADCCPKTQSDPGPPCA